MLNYTIALLSGFLRGAIKWDDENTHNKNRESGSLPDGTYNRDTYIKYCCRSDGSAYTAIELPTRKSFYLFRYSANRCQQVKYMQVKEEWFHWDDEADHNRDRKEGAHPKDTGSASDHKLHYCYYYT